jgi:hypothetical protein
VTEEFTNKSGIGRYDVRRNPLTKYLKEESMRNIIVFSLVCAVVAFGFDSGNAQAVSKKNQTSSS